MTRQESDRDTWVVGAVVGTAAVLGGVLLTIAAWPQTPNRRSPQRKVDGLAPLQFTDADVEAAARMLASENPRGSQALHIEQVYTQLRSAKAGQSLAARITAGSGWGPQGERSGAGGVRPVATTELATAALRMLAQDVLAGVRPSKLPGARQFFEPAQQDRILALALQARQKQAAGIALTAREKRLLGYHLSAKEVRARWLAEGATYLDQIDGVEFYA